MTLWTQLGPGPLDVFIGAVRVHTGLPLSIAVWLVVGMLIAVAWALGRRPGVGTIVGPLVVGVVMQSVSALLANYDAPTSIVRARSASICSRSARSASVPVRSSCRVSAPGPVSCSRARRPTDRAAGNLGCGWRSRSPGS